MIKPAWTDVATIHWSHCLILIYIIKSKEHMLLDLGCPRWTLSPIIEMTDLGQGKWIYSTKQSLVRQLLTKLCLYNNPVLRSCPPPRPPSFARDSGRCLLSGANRECEMNTSVPSRTGLQGCVWAAPLWFLLCSENTPHRVHSSQ